MTKPLRLLLALSLSLTACVATEEDGAGDCQWTPQTVYPDADGDGYGDPSKAMQSCEELPPAGFVTVGGDCRDDISQVNPAGKEVCDAIDNDCDGVTEDDDPSLELATTKVFYRDNDNDGFGDPNTSTSVTGCEAPMGYAKNKTDCDDTRAAVNPNAKEVCDHLDNDCDGKFDITDTNLDMTTATPYYRDFDHDNVGAGLPTMACDQPSGWVAVDDDCNDNDNLSFPGGIEICDGADNDCDGGVDGTSALPNRCTALVGTYTGTYSHLAQEKVGSTVVNSMSCTGSGSGSLALNRRPGIQGVFTCTYANGGGLFATSQKVTLSANVSLTGVVTGTVVHEYDGNTLKRTYNVSGTQTATGLSLAGTGGLLPSQFSTVPWQVSFNFSATR